MNEFTKEVSEEPAVGEAAGGLMREGDAVRGKPGRGKVPAQVSRVSIRIAKHKQLCLAACVTTLN